MYIRVYNLYIYIHCIYTLHNVWMYHCKNNDPKRKGFCWAMFNAWNIANCSIWSPVASYHLWVALSKHFCGHSLWINIQRQLVWNNGLYLISINIFSAGIFIQFSTDVGKISSSNIIHTKNITNITYIMVVITS
jgi:hypothetical protein